MSIVTIDDTNLTNIGNAIRGKIGTTTKYKPNEMSSAISNIQTGIEPTGTKEITENGTYDVTNYASANVNVPTGGGELPEKGAVITEYTKTGWPFKLSIVGMTEIPDSMFYEAISSTTSRKGFLYQCTKPVLPDNLQKIGAQAFYGCNKLLLTELPSGLTYIGDGAFQTCSNLKLTSLPSGLTYLGSSAFASCSNLALNELPSGLTSIENYVFQSCSDVVLTSLPSGLTKIGDYAFHKAGISATRLPDTLTTLGIRCFAEMSQCGMKFLPSGVTSIPNACFYGNTYITELTFEGDIDTIGTQVFYNCTNFNKLVLPNVTKVPTLSNANSFAYTGVYNKNGYIYFPDSLVETAKSSSNWSNYASQIKGISELPA